MLKKNMMISVDSLFDTRAGVLRMVMGTTPEYLISKGWQVRHHDGVAQLDSKQLKFYYDKRTDVVLRKSNPCNIDKLLLSNQMLIKNKKLSEDIHDEVTLDVNMYPYTDKYIANIETYLKPFKFKLDFINKKPDLELYSQYEFVIDYDGLEAIQDPYIMAKNKLTAPGTLLFFPALHSGIGEDENFDFLFKYCDELAPIIDANPLDVSVFSF